VRSIALGSLLLAGAAGMAAPAPAADSEAALQAIERRLQALEDERAIYALQHEYLRLLQSRDWDAYVQMFTEDAQMDIIEGVLTGRQAIHDRMANASARLAANAPADRTSVTFLTDIQITVDGDRATMHSRFNSMSQQGEEPMTVSGSGRYDFQLQRVNGKWLISRIYVDWDLPRRNQRPAP
jgi:uncharacterized protein (TIGR02246 family)